MPPIGTKDQLGAGLIPFPPGVDGEVAVHDADHHSWLELHIVGRFAIAAIRIREDRHLRVFLSHPDQQSVPEANETPGEVRPVSPDVLRAEDVGQIQRA